MSELAAPSGESVSKRLARILAERIVRGDIPPGSRLRQDHIASEFGASHVPVREAFRLLEAQGLVINEPRRGVHVPALDPRTIMEVTEMRATLEVLALRHAIPVLKARDIAAARQAIHEAEISTDLRVWEKANRQFHWTLIAPCDMPRLLATIDDLYQASARFLFATWQALDWQPRSDEEHHAIVAAIEAGDVAKACSILEKHILAAGEALGASVRERRQLTTA